MLLRMSSVLLVASLLAREASACELDLCAGTVAVTGLERANTADLPTDGVLLLKARTSGDLDPEQLPARIQLTVTRDGLEIPGALELAVFTNLLRWRPDAPLQPGTYLVAATLDNPGAPSGCVPSADLSLTFDVADATTAPLVAASIDAATFHFDEPLITLTGVVCCNDAYPFDQVMCGMSYGLTWDRGLCTARETRGYLRITLTADPSADPISAGQWARVLRQDGELVAGGPATTFIREIEAPTCFRIDQRSLASGAVVEGEELCFGDADVDRLGVRPLDPKAALAGQCQSDLYTCEIEAGSWDPKHCMSWGLEDTPPPADPPASTDAGCNLRGTENSVPALLLLALVSRRRRTVH